MGQNNMSGEYDSSKSMKVSVITPSFNQGQFIEKTILSVLCQDYLNLEYIVVDGLSDDQTHRILNRYKKYIDVVVVEKDDGQSDALNKGFKLATGDILAYLNSDDCYANPSVISKVVHHFQAAPDTGVVYGRREMIDENGYFFYCFPYSSFSKEYLYLADYIPQECAFWSREIFEKADPFISREFDFAMDYELWLRFLEFDCKFLAVDEVFGLFRSYASQKTIAQWQSKGLPEIAKLHQQYLGRSISDAEMQNYFKAHAFGIDQNLHPEAGLLQEQLWVDFTTLKRQLLSRFPLDGWVFHQKENLRQRLRKGFK
ncbi:MAG: glycosyltransferase family 2 protein [Leptolyngbyaceae cyanobacterium bins.302]|nr:glycosyltransferase family 2 protein [Leptolyngbyaceae cyanobacterium bins.302]